VDFCLSVIIFSPFRHVSIVPQDLLSTASAIEPERLIVSKVKVRPKTGHESREGGVEI